MKGVGSAGERYWAEDKRCQVKRFQARMALFMAVRSIDSRRRL